MKWFNVHDMLPPDPPEEADCYEGYIVYCQNGSSKLTTLLSWTEHGWADINDLYIDGVDETMYNKYVTHWSILPEPPEEEK